MRVEAFRVSPARVKLGGEIRLSLEMISLATKTQKLVIDYAIHYVKNSGGTSAKVFKWTEREIGPGETLVIGKRQTIRDFSTRKHYAGKHLVEVMVNGERLAEWEFVL